MWDNKPNEEQAENLAVAKSEEEWRRDLSPEQFHVLREHGTERPGSSPLNKEYGKGIYYCAGCRQALFGSDAKFDSGTGWPSFFAPKEGAVGTSEDRSFFMTRTEVHCARCGGHLGHVFPDGPKPTGLRYCINGAALQFEPQARASAEGEEEKAALRQAGRSQTATFAAGCFWGVEAEFRQIEGVIDAVVGYTGGKTAKPTYKEVCTDRTGHAEAVQVTFDPAKVSYERLLDAFWNLHDPTTLNRQGPDVGSQYRSAIFAHDAKQEAAAKASLAALEKSGRFKRPIVTEIVKAGPFYRAEEYHQQYFAKRGIAPSCHRG
jgi:peptide methionine sulfoxide reductase msrA/msrB